MPEIAPKAQAKKPSYLSFKAFLSDFCSCLVLGYSPTPKNAPMPYRAKRKTPLVNEWGFS